jgi:hypothetical protein
LRTEKIQLLYGTYEIHHFFGDGLFTNYTS